MSIRMSVFAGLAGLASIALVGCASSPPKGPVVAAQSATAPGVADDGTWMTLAARGARMKIPAGWSFARKGDALVARPKDGKAAIVFAGATTKPELEAQVRAIGDEFRIDEVDFTKGRKANLHGIPVVVFEDMVASTSGTPADVLVLLADAPNGHGVVLVFVMAWDASQAHDLHIIDAANSLRPS